MDVIDAMKNIHDIGELNVFISIVSVVALIVLVITGIQKFMDVLGIETKGSLRRKAQEKRISELENKIMLQESEIKNIIKNYMINKKLIMNNLYRSEAILNKIKIFLVNKLLIFLI